MVFPQKTQITSLFPLLREGWVMVASVYIVGVIHIAHEKKKKKRKIVHA